MQDYADCVFVAWLSDSSSGIQQTSIINGVKSWLLSYFLLEGRNALQAITTEPPLISLQKDANSCTI